MKILSKNKGVVTCVALLITLILTACSSSTDSYSLSDAETQLLEQTPALLEVN